MDIRERNDREGATRARVGGGSTVGEREITQERVFDAPRELVWKMWTDPKHVDRWWGPNGFRNVTESSDFRVGGTWRFLMHGPDGKIWKNWVRYEEIVPNEKLAWAHGGERDEAEFHVTVTFASVGTQTKVSMRTIFPTAEACAAMQKFGAVQGGFQTLARLDGYLPHAASGFAEKNMVLTRVFDAPAKLVFAAWSKPEALTRWWGPKHFTLGLCEVDFRVGGEYRMVMNGPDGMRSAFAGKYLEIVPDQKLVFDARIESMEQYYIVATITFVEENGKTLLTCTQTLLPIPGMDENQWMGWSQQLEKLETFLRAA